MPCGIAVPASLGTRDHKRAQSNRPEAARPEVSACLRGCWALARPTEPGEFLGPLDSAAQLPIEAGVNQTAAPDLDRLGLAALTPIEHPDRMLDARSSEPRDLDLALDPAGRMDLPQEVIFGPNHHRAVSAAGVAQAHRDVPATQAAVDEMEISGVVDMAGVAVVREIFIPGQVTPAMNGERRAGMVRHDRHARPIIEAPAWCSIIAAAPERVSRRASMQESRGSIHPPAVPGSRPAGGLEEQAGLAQSPMTPPSTRVMTMVAERGRPWGP